MVEALSRKEVIRKFRSLGYSGPFSGGKHQFMAKGSHKIRIPNPHILPQAGISSLDWDKI